MRAQSERVHVTTNEGLRGGESPFSNAPTVGAVEALGHVRHGHIEVDPAPRRTKIMDE